MGKRGIRNTGKGTHTHTHAPPLAVIIWKFGGFTKAVLIRTTWHILALCCTHGNSIRVRRKERERERHRGRERETKREKQRERKRERESERE